QAYDRDRHHLGALMGLLEVSDRNKSWPDVQHFAKLAIVERPRSLAARLLLAESCDQQKDYESALQVYQQIQKLAAEHRLDGTPPTDLSSRMQMAQNNLAEALKRKAQERGPAASGK